MRKILSIIIFSLLVLSVATGCSNDTVSNAEQKKEPQVSQTNVENIDKQEKNNDSSDSAPVSEYTSDDNSVSYGGDTSEKTDNVSTLVSYTEEESMMISSFDEEQQKHIQTLSDEERSELFDLLSKQSRYPYRISVLIGDTDPEQPKLTLEKMKEIVNNAMNDPKLDSKIKRYNYIIEEVDKIQEFCDFVPVGESTPTKWYFLDGDRYENVQNVIEIYGSAILHRVLENGDFIIKEVLYEPEPVKASENS